MSARQHLLAILLLPFTVTILVPLFLILLSVWLAIPWLFLYPITVLSLIFGCILIVLGVAVIYKTIRAFARVGKGTLAPWAPTQHFVAVGFYLYVRNPMIVGVLLVLLGEAILFGASLILLWFILFWVMNHLWFIRWEEPDLEQRFGDEYREYKENVPRWIPRRKPWIHHSVSITNAEEKQKQEKT
jgi:protein-S-isoprenylcysteine O-methyltransferase Ste14